MIALLWLAACGESEVTVEDCVDVVPAERLARTEFERSLVEPLLEGIRGGVQPWDEEGIGVCRGERTCESFLGAEAGTLDPGDYLVRANLRVPDVGPPGTWTVRFESVCTPAGGEPVTWNRTYEVMAPGGERPFRIGVLRRIRVEEGAPGESCSWTLTAPHPDGDKVYSGSWTTGA